MQKMQVGNDVEWKWGRSKAEGQVTQKFTTDVERRIKGKADKNEPAFLIRQDDGAGVLKSQSEVKETHG